MASTHPEMPAGHARLRSIARLGAVALLLTTAPQAMAQVNLDPSLPISLDADSSDFDRQRNRVVFTGLRISQGPLQISADRAQASQIDFENSQWEFDGNVRIELENAELRASTATLTFLGFRLTRAVAVGSPAEFEDSGTASNRMIRGRAGQLEYDLTNGVIRLSEGAWLSEGGNEITGATLLYNVPDERILAEGEGEGDRVRITIVPPASDATRPEAEDFEDTDPNTDDGSGADDPGSDDAAPDPETGDGESTEGPDDAAASADAAATGRPGQ